MNNAKITPSSPPQVSALIAADLQRRLLLPTDPEYAARNNSYYSNTSKLKPACILQPQSTDEVATAVKTLAATGHTFAIRSGGCNFWPSNNIENGVTIDLNLINSIEYHAEADTVCIGPGARWGQVYEYLSTYNRTVGGGRETSVGVGGLVLSGGSNFYSGRHGLTCDQVIEFEVVLATGVIIIAKAGGDHEDLLVALRGGGNNFGVVTKITMRTISCGQVWGGGLVFPPDVIAQVSESFVDITDKVAQDQDNNLICMVANLEPGQPAVIASLCVNVAGVENPPILKEWLSFPTLFNSCKKTTLLEVMATTKQISGYHCIWFTLTLQNSSSLILKAVELHSTLTATLEAHIADSDFMTQCCFQPFPCRSPANTFHRKNVLGHESQDRHGIIWTGHVMVRTPELKKWAYPHVRKWYQHLRNFAESERGLLPWMAASYADPSQEVLQSYGSDNVRFIREVANKYDPEGVFQTLCPGGFKISAVGGE